ncbi:MAG: DUF2950 domain-containing protein [Candidatus Acidiferrales bacterium]
MQLTKIEVKHFSWNVLARAGAAAVVLACLPVGAFAQEKGQKTFSSAEEASQALVKAAQDNDEKTLIEIVGKSAKEIISSGDDKQDAKHREHFVKRYEEMHRLFKEPDGTTTLYVGVDNWPMPISLVNKGNMWFFDGEAAKQEILFRRVGKNEVSTIRVCEQLAAAEKEYFAMQHAYAAKIASDPDQKNGLYWSGEPKSPIGPKIAAADTTSNNASLTPFRGYYFRVLTDQGKDAPGGAKSYMVDGKMTGGFAIEAYPVEYRSSGVMTFTVGSDGVVREKDLGKKTETEAKAMKSFNPDSSWHQIEEQQEATNTQATK